MWVATTAGLDWPRSYSTTEQQQSLRNIVARVKAARFNTIFFQVRARGDAYYRSAYEPWAENLTGTLGQDPGWDPLAVLLEEAHRHDIEVHAWFNVYKVGGPNPVGFSTPPHPTRLFPHRVVTADNEKWLDPGDPDVAAHTLRTALDLVRKYHIDGIHFDYIRYPGREIPDDPTYRLYGNGRDRAEWRRSNITRFVHMFYDSAMAINPGLKVGSAPLGVYSVGTASNGWGSFHSYYQDSQGWLAAGKHDYLAPQIYWDIGATDDDPDFAALVRSWSAASHGRHIYAGIAAYKRNVFREMAAQIDSSRAANAAGQAFFRYEHIAADFSPFRGRYATPAIVPPMPWKDSIPPNPPQNLAVTQLATDVFHLEWQPPAAEPSARRYAVFRSTSPTIHTDEATSLVAVVPGGGTYYVDSIAVPAGAAYYYTVTALSRNNVESIPSNVGSVRVREVLALGGKLTHLTGLVASVAKDNASRPLVAYRLAAPAEVSLDLLGSNHTVVATLATGLQQSGTYVVGLGQVEPGAYIVRLKAGENTIEQRVEVRR